MANKYFNSSFLAGAMIISALSYGQIKQPSVTNFANPFQSKVKPKSTNILTPNNGNKVASIQQTKPKIETVNGSFSVNIEKKGLQKQNVFFSQWEIIKPQIQKMTKPNKQNE